MFLPLRFVLFLGVSFLRLLCDCSDFFLKMFILEYMKATQFLYIDFVSYFSKYHSIVLHNLHCKTIM